MTMLSTYTDLGPIALPKFQARQKYMHTFDASNPVMAEGFEDYGPIVSQLCRAAGHSGKAHMTVDEKIIEPGMSQRRPGAHVDGRFMVSKMDWSHPPRPAWSHDPYPEPRGPGWLHHCNEVPLPRMAVIIASSVAGCTVYPGEFDTQPASDGDLEHIRPQLGEGILLPANQGFLLSPDCIHESMRFSEPTQRTFLRIALE